ncbi:MAG: nitroreductase family protein [Ignavibacteriales bacterium]|nr:nitroreductase family protein [Ignavibacteriales bacterium]
MLHELIIKRNSPRAFTEKEIEPEKLEDLFEAARWAASSMNEQPWRFIVAVRKDLENFDKMVKILNEPNKIWAKNAGALILTVAKQNLDFNNKLNKYAFYDVGQSVANLTLQATAINLYVHQMGGFSAEKAKEVFLLPDEFSAVSVLAIGYKGEPEMLPENLKVRELAVRTRKPIDEIIYDGKFGVPWESEIKHLEEI